MKAPMFKLKKRLLPVLSTNEIGKSFGLSYTLQKLNIIKMRYWPEMLMRLQNILLPPLKIKKHGRDSAREVLRR